MAGSRWRRRCPRSTRSPRPSRFRSRYVGNHGFRIWRSYDINEVNIFENGFVQEFKNAQRNLQINQAAGVTSFENRGLPGQLPLPIFGSAFGARGTQPELAAASGYANGTFVTMLQQSEAGALANALAGSGGTSSYLCRMLGSALGPCATLGYNAPGPYPINFFGIAKRFRTGSGSIGVEALFLDLFNTTNFLVGAQSNDLGFNVNINSTTFGQTSTTTQTAVGPRNVQLRFIASW